MRRVRIGVRGRTAIVFALAFLVLAGVVLAAVNLLTGIGIGLRTPHLSAVPAVGARAEPSGDPALVVELGAIARQQLLLWSVVGLLAATGLSALVGWILAGRLLRPVVRVTAAAERISARDLHQRIALDGPDDELRRLADTFDGLLARLEASFDSQRRFIANASHELRTPLAIQRTALQVGLRPDDPDGVARTRDQLLDANRRSDALIESLLVLATSERGLRERESCDLHVIVAETVASRGEMARERGLTLAADAGPCVVGGDAVLLGQLVANLVDNALEYNAAGGHVAVTLTADRLSIANTGPLVAPDAVDGLFEPFRRGDGDRRHGRGHHSGLGLSIVAAIVAAHGMSLSARAPASGGLVVDIALGDSRLPAPTIVG